MNKFSRHAVAIGLSALGLTLANAVPGLDEPSTTRAEVRQQLHDARTSQRLTPSGEIGDTPQVLAAREAFNARQAAALRAEVEKAAATTANRRALDELVAELQARDDGDDVVATLTSSH